MIVIILAVLVLVGLAAHQMMQIDRLQRAVEKGIKDASQLRKELMAQDDSVEYLRGRVLTEEAARERGLDSLRDHVILSSRQLGEIIELVSSRLDTVNGRVDLLRKELGYAREDIRIVSGCVVLLEGQANNAETTMSRLARKGRKARQVAKTQELMLGGVSARLSKVEAEVRNRALTQCHSGL